MKIVDFQSIPAHEIEFMNAGHAPGQFYEERLPVHIARVDQLPEGLSALVATGDLQGRERSLDFPSQPGRLLGEVLPVRLVSEILPRLGIRQPERTAALLTGDFYTVPDLGKRGGSGDVTNVWRSFAKSLMWVAGVPGNHDSFGGSTRPSLGNETHFLDGDVADIDRFRVAGIGGIVGNSTKPNRRSLDDYLATLKRILRPVPDVILMHEGADGPEAEQRGRSEIREVLLASRVRLAVQGHAHWQQPFVEFPGGLQLLNVDGRVVVFTM